MKKMFKLDYYRLIATASESFELSIGKHNACQTNKHNILEHSKHAIKWTDCNTAHIT